MNHISAAEFQHFVKEVKTKTTYPWTVYTVFAEDSNAAELQLFSNDVGAVSFSVTPVVHDDLPVMSIGMNHELKVDRFVEKSNKTASKDWNTMVDLICKYFDIDLADITANKE